MQNLLCMIQLSPLGIYQDTLQSDPLFLDNVAIITDFNERFPRPSIEMHAWTPEMQNMQSDNIEGIFGFLQAPYIIDVFGSDHVSRRDWRRQLQQRYDWFEEFYRETNALKGNRITVALLHAALLPRGYMEEHNEKLKTRINEAFNSAEPSVHYEIMATDNKVTYVMNLKIKLYSILGFLEDPLNPR